MIIHTLSVHVIQMRTQGGNTLTHGDFRLISGPEHCGDVDRGDESECNGQASDVHLSCPPLELKIPVAWIHKTLLTRRLFVVVRVGVACPDRELWIHERMG